MYESPAMASAVKSFRRQAGPGRPAAAEVLRFRGILLLVLLLGCAKPPLDAPLHPVRTFDFDRDVFAFANELVFDYGVDEGGRLPSTPPSSSVDFAQRCVLMSRVVRQFHVNAEFSPGLPRVGEERYRELVAEVFATDARAKQPASERIVIPGYPGLRSFSKDHEMLFKEALNQRWLAYFQKGNWRMIFPFWRNQQRATAEGLVSGLGRGELAVLHAVRFPNIEINHTVLLFGVEETPEEIRFRFYDPNEAVHPRVLVYDRARRTFYYPKTFYFAGGPIRAYEVYDGAIY